VVDVLREFCVRHAGFAQQLRQLEDRPRADLDAINVAPLLIDRKVRGGTTVTSGRGRAPKPSKAA
jgi:hypothetical protein